MHFHTATELDMEVELVCEDMTERKWQGGVRHMYTLALTFIYITGLNFEITSFVNIHANSVLRTYC